MIQLPAILVGMSVVQRVVMGIGLGFLIAAGISLYFCHKRVASLSETVGEQRTAIQRAADINTGHLRTIADQRESLDNVWRAALASQKAGERAIANLEIKAAQRADEVRFLRGQLNAEITQDMQFTDVPSGVFLCIEAAASGRAGSCREDTGISLRSDSD